MMKFFDLLAFVFVFVFLCAQNVKAQYKKIHSIQIGEPVTFATVDRPGELYLVSPQGNVRQYSTDGNLTSSGKFPFAPTLFDARDGSRLFAYSKDEKKYAFFPPTFQFEERIKKIDSAFAIHPYLVCSSGDHDLIIIDSADWSLKKVNVKTSKVLFETVIKVDKEMFNDILSMREYQNFIFIHERHQGILIFNMIGKLLKQLPGDKIDHFNFLGEELYYKSGDTLYFFDLFNTETRNIKLPERCEFALLTDERLYLVAGNKVDIFLVEK